MSPAVAATPVSRRWLAPEVVQTTSMDCGPAALKCLLDGHGRPASYGRLREACQTSVDGTSIDSLEEVAGQLGLTATQELLSVAHLRSLGAHAYPAVVVVRHADTHTHFLVVWRQVAGWVQVMDPAAGRQWWPVSALIERLHEHDQGVEAAVWRDWASGEEFRGYLNACAAELKVPAKQVHAWLQSACQRAGWYALAALEAALALVTSLVRSGALEKGLEAANFTESLWLRTLASGHDMHAHIPYAYWSVRPDADNTDPTVERLRVRGAVLLRVRGLTSEPPAEKAPELASVLSEKPLQPLPMLWRMVRQDGLAAIWLLLAALALSGGMVAVEALLLQGLGGVHSALALESQRLAAIAGFLVLLGALLALRLPIAAQTLRMGRRLELRLRMALLAKLPRLHDQYFQSRPISDMADRAHQIHAVRGFPATVLGAVQALLDLLLTWAALAWIAPAWVMPAAGLVLIATALAWIAMPWQAERSLRMQNIAAALHGFFLDAMLGAAVVQAHNAGRNVRRQHESLLLDWARSFRALVRVNLNGEALQALVCNGMALWLLLRHFEAHGIRGGTDLLLVFWALKLPVAAARLTTTLQAYPAERNAFARLLEPLLAPDARPVASAAEPSSDNSSFQTDEIPVAIDFRAASLVAMGHPILRDLNLRIEAGEHIAIVGASGAGKSSLLSLLLGWHHLASGEMLVNGGTLDSLAQERLRQRTAWVDPAVQLWNKTLLDNMEFARDPGQATPRSANMADVLAAAGLGDVAARLPTGLQTLLGEGGGRLSGGEGQRVRLARALAMQSPGLVLLDEPFRGLDRAHRRRLLTEVREWWRVQTLLCVTHDLAETLEFPRVLVIHEGRIVEDGPPKTLLAQDAHYAAMMRTEIEVARNSWQGAHWRQVRLEAGQAVESCL